MCDELQPMSNVRVNKQWNYNMSKTANPEHLWIIPLSMSFVTDNLMLLYKTCNFLEDHLKTLNA